MGFNSIENYIVDFICRKMKLIIEIDGASHQYKTEEDKIRDERLTDLGYQVIRVDEGEVLNDINNIIKTIEYYLPEELINPPDPLRQGGEKL